MLEQHRPLGEPALQVASEFVLCKGWGGQDRAPPLQVGPRLKDERREKMKDIFRTFDIDKSGTISRAEMATVLSRLGKMAKEEIDDLMAQADKNGNGVLEIDEFADWLCGEEASTQDAQVIFEHGEALRPLFDAFDRRRDGLITLEEFTDCHQVLQGALALNPVAGNADEKKRDWLSAKAEAADIFRIVDKNGDNSLGFADFARYVKGMIAESGISTEELADCCSKLAYSLHNVFKGIKMAQSGLIPEDQPEQLEQWIADLAETARALEASLEANKNAKTAKQTTWTHPPEGMTVAALTLVDMQLHPLNMRLVEKFEYDILCVPEPGGLGEPQDRKWLGEVSRKVTYKSSTGVTQAGKKEVSRCYEYTRITGRWASFPQANFTELLKTFSRELGMFCILETNADYGIELTWETVKRSMIQGVDIGWITTEQRLKFNAYVESMDKLDNVQKYLSTLKMRPRLVMAILSKLGIVEVNPTWKAFMMNA